MIRASLLVIFALLLSGLSAQDKEKPYEGDIRESDLRRTELVTKIKSNAIPPSIRLRYSGTESDFLVFYDLEGKSIYYKYREDRFDTDAERKIADLIPGEAYEVSGTFLGFYQASLLYSTDNPRYREMLENRNAIPAFIFRSARPLRLDQILF